jgi:hypothetical protein
VCRSTTGVHHRRVAVTKTATTVAGSIYILTVDCVSLTLRQPISSACVTNHALLIPFG